MRIFFKKKLEIKGVLAEKYFCEGGPVIEYVCTFDSIEKWQGVLTNQSTMIQHDNNANTFLGLLHFPTLFLFLQSKRWAKQLR